MSDALPIKRQHNFSRTWTQIQFRVFRFAQLSNMKNKTTRRCLQVKLQQVNYAHASGAWHPQFIDILNHGGKTHNARYLDKTTTPKPDASYAILHVWLCQTAQHSSSAHEEMQGMCWPKETAHFRTRTESTSVTETRGTSSGKTDGRLALTDKAQQKPA